MKIMFVHQNMPGQYREFIRFLIAQGGHEIVFLTQRDDLQIKGVKVQVYKPIHKSTDASFRLSQTWEDATAVGFSAAQAAKSLHEKDGFKPDIVIGHTGWGELTFFKEVWPDVPIIGFFEYFYRATGGMVGFDPEEPASEQAGFFAHARNAVPFANIQTVDLGHSPTYWQRDRFPTSFHSKIYVCHDGIRTDNLLPNPKVSVSLNRLAQPLTREDEVVTYVARNLERARGFHVVMRALPKVLAERPKARVLIVGGTEQSYGRNIKSRGGMRGLMEEELGDRIDWDRVHFLGRVPYQNLMEIIQLGRCHLYMSMPFVLSWSLLEAMSMQATVIGSDVAPTQEVIAHGENGLLVDYFKPEALADQIIDVLARPKDYAHIGPAARARVVDHYDFNTRCLPEHIRQINALVPKAKAISPVL
ncbi:MAG: glycosyltransferase [Pseudomonadota bacterium]